MTISNPSSVFEYGTNDTPALLMRTSILPSLVLISLAQSLTERRLERSHLKRSKSIISIYHHYSKIMCRQHQFISKVPYLLVQYQICAVQLPPDIVSGCFGSVHVPASHDHASASSRQIQDSFLADAGVASGDDDRLVRNNSTLVLAFLCRVFF